MLHYVLQTLKHCYPQLMSQVEPPVPCHSPGLTPNALTGIFSTLWFNVWALTTWYSLPLLPSKTSHQVVFMPSRRDWTNTSSAQDCNPKAQGLSNMYKSASYIFLSSCRSVLASLNGIHEACICKRIKKNSRSQALIPIAVLINIHLVLKMYL